VNLAIVRILLLLREMLKIKKAKINAYRLNRMRGRSKRLAGCNILSVFSMSTSRIFGLIIAIRARYSSLRRIVKIVDRAVILGIGAAWQAQSPS
jgi:hypothetical protein